MNDRLREIEVELKQLRRKRRDLLEEKRCILENRQPNANAAEHWIEPIFKMIESHPGASREKLINELYKTGVEITRPQLTNTLTTLRRRGWIENHGTRQYPEWHARGRIPRARWNTRESRVA